MDVNIFVDIFSFNESIILVVAPSLFLVSIFALKLIKKLHLADKNCILAVNY